MNQATKADLPSPKRKIRDENPETMENTDPKFHKWFIKNLEEQFHTCRSCWTVTRGEFPRGIMAVDHHVPLASVKNDSYWLHKAYICQRCLDNPHKSDQVRSFTLRRTLSRKQKEDLLRNVHK